jgi:hypothetical protein
LQALPTAQTGRLPAARRRLPRFLFDYADGGAYPEATMQAKCAICQGSRYASAYCATSMQST